MLHITPRFQSLKFRIVGPTGSGFLQQEVNCAYFQKRFVCTFHVVLRSKCFETRSKKRFQEGSFMKSFPGTSLLIRERCGERIAFWMEGTSLKSFNEHTTTRLHFILRYLATVQGSLERVTRATFPQGTSFYTDQLESALKSWKTGKKKQNSGTWLIRWLASQAPGFAWGFETVQIKVKLQRMTIRINKSKVTKNDDKDNRYNGHEPDKGKPQRRPKNTRLRARGNHSLHTLNAR